MGKLRASEIKEFGRNGSGNVDIDILRRALNSDNKVISETYNEHDDRIGQLELKSKQDHGNINTLIEVWIPELKQRLEKLESFKFSDFRYEFDNLVRMLEGEQLVKLNSFTQVKKDLFDKVNEQNKRIEKLEVDNTELKNWNENCIKRQQKFKVGQVWETAIQEMVFIKCVGMDFIEGDVFKIIHDTNWIGIKCSSFQLQRKTQRWLSDGTYSKTKNFHNVQYDLVKLLS